MLKKSIALLLCVSMLLTCFVFTGFAAVTGEEAAQIALADAELTYGNSISLADAGDAKPVYDENEGICGYLVYLRYEAPGSVQASEFHYNLSFLFGEYMAYVIDTEGAVVYFDTLDVDELIAVPDGGKLYFCEYYGILWICDADGNLTEANGLSCTRTEMNAVFSSARAAEAEEREEKEMDERLENTDSVSDVIENFKNLGFKKFVEYFIELLQRVCRYVIDRYISFPTGWDKAAANASVDEALNAYCEENNCTVTEVYRVDKDYFVPNRQTYFSDGEDVGSGVCGVASWEMILGGYRDSGVLSKLPDDKTMYREIMAIMDDISAELQPVISNFISMNESLIDDVINPLMIDTIGMYIDKDFEFNSYEVIGTLDIGIALYLNQYGYTEYARRVLSNLTIAIPVISTAKRTLLMNGLRNDISSWISEKTDGKLNIPVACGSTSADTVLRALEQGEPAILGCWASILGDNDLTNHYFVISSLFKVKAEIKISDTKTVTIERNLVEVYDTWDNDSVELVDFDALYRTTVCDANTLALLY